MIIRILGRGQWVIQPDDFLRLNEIDAGVEKAVADGDATALRSALEALAAAVRELGDEVPDDIIVESDLVLPDVDATVDEVRALLEAQSQFYGLIPDEEH